MEKTIISELKKIEKEHKVKILFAVESGSRSWGFSSKDSDYDVRFVYYHKTNDYLGIETPKQVIEEMTGNIDLVGWDLKKFAELFTKSNPTVSEWLTSRIIYINSPYKNKLLKIFNKELPKTALIKHYTSLARMNYEKYINKKEEQVNLKKYVYILRAIACIEHLKKNNNTPELNYKKVIHYLPKYAQVFMEKIVKQKQESEKTLGEKNEQVNKLIESYFNKKINNDNKKTNNKTLNNLVIKIITTRKK